MISYSNWSVVSVNFLVVLYLALSGVALCSVLHLVGAKWGSEVKGLTSSLFALFPLALVLLVVLLVGGEHTFPWIGHTTHGEDVHMPGWYTLPLLATREVVGILFVGYLCMLFIKRQDLKDNSPEDAARFHTIATWIPFFYVLYGTMVAWDFEMTLKPSWHSAIYGMQNIVTNFGMFLAFMTVWMYALNSRGNLKRPIGDFMSNFMAQMMLSFTLLWMYTFFAQYLTIWYGNLGDEVDRINEMQNGDYSVLWWSMIFLKFVIPFVALAFPQVRHSPQATLAVAIGIIIGTLFERYTWISGINGTGTIPLVWGVAVSGVVVVIGYWLVSKSMHKRNLIKG
jgi:hypothetical protein